MKETDIFRERRSVSADRDGDASIGKHLPKHAKADELVEQNCKIRGSTCSEEREERCQER